MGRGGVTARPSASGRAIKCDTGVTKWIHGWKKNGWKTADKKPVKNQELWMAMEEACARHDITWKWVKGHSGDPNNDRADELARQGTDEARGKT